MKCLITLPYPIDSPSGNAVSARRVAGMIAPLGCSVDFAESGSFPDETDASFLIALNALKSADAISSFRSAYPKRPIVLMLTGTDLKDLSQASQRSLALADRIVAPHDAVPGILEKQHRLKTTTIIKSVVLPEALSQVEPAKGFRAVFVAHLRKEKDPFRAEEATRLLSESSQIEVIHLGAEMSDGFAAEAEARALANPRYRWLGTLSREETLSYIASADVSLNTSFIEGASNAICESIVLGTPVLASRILGNVGLLDERYPGLFDPGDSGGLASLLERAESDPTFLNDLNTRVSQLAPRHAPEHEAACWSALLGELPLALGAETKNPIT